MEIPESHTTISVALIMNIIKTRSVSCETLQTNMNPALAFGERVSSFIFRDAALLNLTPSTDLSLQSTVLVRPPRSIEALSNVKPEKKKTDKDKLIRKHTSLTLKSTNNEKTREWSSRAISHAKLVQLQLSKSWTEIGPSKAQSEVSKNHIKKPAKNAIQRAYVEPFRLSDLPPEVLELIFTYEFQRTSGGFPKLLRATEGCKALYLTAKAVYCRVNNFSIVLKNDNFNSKSIGALEENFKKLIKNITIVVP